MNSKDVIYIDSEDDITAIIGKVKSAKNKIVALVPPKRASVLQSAVNLKLLQKAAVTAEKHVVLITNDHSLVTLAAGVRMPVAKNLQSRPEVPIMEAPVDDSEEVIDGQTIPVGDVAKTLGAVIAGKSGSKPKTEDQQEKTEVGGAALNAAKINDPVNKAVNKIKSKIPNFNSFRKKVFLIGGGAVVLAAFLIWAIVFAPKATITITAKTSPVNINKKLTMDTNLAQSDPAKFSLKPVVQQIKKSVATEFDATGTKDIGAKAKGTITVRNCDYADDELTLPVGTKFTGANGKVFVTTKAVSVAGRIPPGSTCTLGGAQAGKTDVTVEALESGTAYNVGSQGYAVSVAGKVDGVGAEMSGGTTEVIKIVSQEDVDKSKAQLPPADSNAAKAELKALFAADQIVIEESFEVKAGPVVSAPNVGEQSARAKITQETTFTITGITRTDIDAILKTALDDVTRDKSDQQAYSYGEDRVAFQDYERVNDGVNKASLVTTGFVGPKIDVNQLAEQLVDKRYGEIQAIVNNIPGVQDVTIDLSPFWISRAPEAHKIDIKFSVANGS